MNKPDQIAFAQSIAKDFGFTLSKKDAEEALSYVSVNSKDFYYELKQMIANHPECPFE